MSDVLTQAEIDELLNALTTGEETHEKRDVDDAPKTKIYDFKTANRFPKEQIKTFTIVFQTFSQLFSNKLSNILRISCECEVMSIEECSFNEFHNSLPLPVILAVINSPPMYGQQMIGISPEVSYMLISRLFGGNAAGENSKQFTEIEQALVERVLRQTISVYDEAWDKVFKLNTEIERIETSPQFAQIIGTNEPVAVVGLSIKMGDESGLMSICIPHSSIEPIIKQLNTRMLFSGGFNDGRRSEDYVKQLSDRIVNTPVPLTALFSETPASVSDIVNLQIGDVIRLDHKLDEPLTIKIHHIPKFRANVGTIGKRYAMQIVDIIKEEGDENESFAG